ncbi:MAG: class I SAM-dependent methyltransferase [Desulfobacula sp.]|nr:class I SAM-dependent methyltransferase [Desulfobacula sp.]
MTDVLNLGSHPISHRLLKSIDHDEYIHPVNLCYCKECGLLQLTDPIPSEKLYSTYNWLSSWKPNPQIPGVLSLIKELPGINKSSKIIEIGSNDGSFLNDLRKLGFQNIYGIEPSSDGVASAVQNGIDTLPGYFTNKTALSIAQEKGRPDLIISRHVLEHVQDLILFIEGIQTLLKEDGYILIEVPDTDFILEEMDYSQIWEEHTNYFSLKTLNRYLSQIGISQVYSGKVQFSGQSLIYIGKRQKNYPVTQPDLSKQTQKVLQFKEQWPDFKDGVQIYLDGFKKKNKKIAVYGAGCRACSLINFTGISKYIDFIVDDQPEKLNSFLPGSKLPILDRSALISNPIDLCLLAVNAENNEKVIKNNLYFIKNGGQFVPILPQSSDLPCFWTSLKRVF